MNNLKVYDSSEQLEGLRFKVVEVLFGNVFLKFKYRKQQSSIIDVDINMWWLQPSLTNGRG